MLHHNIYLLDERGRVLWTSAIHEEWIALARDKLPAWHNHLTPEDASAMQTAIGQAIVTGQPQFVRFQYRDNERPQMGHVYLSRLPTRDVLLIASVRALDPAVDQLTEREKQVLVMGVECTTQQIAERLGISPSTIDTTRRNAGDKLGLSGPQLVRWAVENLL